MFRHCFTFGIFSVLLAKALTPPAVAASLTPGGEFSFRGGDFAQTDGMRGEDAIRAKSTGVLSGYGAASYSFDIDAGGWYAIWIESADWQADFLLDGHLLLHSAPSSRTLPSASGLQKLLSLPLAPGKHALTISRPWHPGLPFVKQVLIRKVRGAADAVRMTASADRAVFRANDKFAVEVRALRQVADRQFTLMVNPSAGGPAIFSQRLVVSAGVGDQSAEVGLPTSHEGVFTARLLDESGRSVDREIEYVVVDPDQAPTIQDFADASLVGTIDAARVEPDYSSTPTRVSSGGGLNYRESGTRGQIENRGHADYFAYRLNLPSSDGLYMVEFDIPDDADRTTSLSVIQDFPSPYSSDAGVLTGKPFGNSGRIEKHQIFFQARQKDPRVLVMNWHAGQRSAISTIRVFRIGQHRQPLPPHPNRSFGFYLEEPLRFTTYFGSDPRNSGWGEMLASATRYAEWTRYVGGNLWHQTVTAYQATLWPSKNLPGFGPDDEGGVGLGRTNAAPSRRDFAQKDIVRLLLLVAEKFQIRMVLELQAYPNEYLARRLSERFRSSDPSSRSFDRPWLVERDDGTKGKLDPGTPYLSPIYPGVQAWARELVMEVATRYRDSKALQGVGIRFLGYQFGGWQGFGSLRWGYDDYTFSKFVHDVWHDKLPAGYSTPKSTTERKHLLVDRNYKAWVDWRVAAIAGWHNSLASELRALREDLILYLNLYGPQSTMGEFSEDLASVGAWRKKGWLTLLRENGIDPTRYETNPNIRLSDASDYPAGVRANGGYGSALGLDLYGASLDPVRITASAKPTGSGLVHTTRFYNQYMEADLDPKALGIRTGSGSSELLRICAAINPIGRAGLNRYTHALISGNLVEIVDGGLGYVFGQPEYLKEFLQTFGSIPRNGMKRLGPAGTTDLALWYSAEKGKSQYFYIVNASAKAREVVVEFTGEAMLRRLDQEDRQSPAATRTLKVSMQPYGLALYSNSASEVAPLAVRAIAPAAATPSRTHN